MTTPWTIEARVDGGVWTRQDGPDGLPTEHTEEGARLAVDALRADADGTGVEFRAVEVSS